MSLDIVKKNSSSPFHLQRSIVDQGGSGGAYESGGFNPDMVYNNDAANQAIESLGKVIGAAIYAKGDDKAKPKDKDKKILKPELPNSPAEDAASFQNYKKEQELRKIGNIAEGYDIYKGSIKITKR